MNKYLYTKVEEAVRYSSGGSDSIYAVEQLGIDTTNLHTEDELQDIASDAILNQDYGLARHIIDALEDGYLDDVIYAWDEEEGEYDTIEILETPDDLIDYLDNNF